MMVRAIKMGWPRSPAVTPSAQAYHT
jgi:hypothetical protein